MEASQGKLVLIGLPGSGKSTLGKKLSLKLQYPYYDLDKLIEQEIGCTIAQFFKDEGEDSFRSLESRILKGILEEEGGFILSTGGGAPCYHGNMEMINRHSTAIYIDVPTEVLVKRLIKNGGGERPMFFDMSEAEVAQKIADLKSARENFYTQAKIKLSGSNITTELILSTLDQYRFRN
jgi:shikimate kinase